LSGARVILSHHLEKLEWCRYPMVKNFEDMFICFDVIHERDGLTDRRTDTV